MRKTLLTILFVLCLSSVTYSQGTTNYPTSLDTNTTLPQAVDAKVTFATAAINNSATTLTVNSTAGVPTSGVLQIDSELLAYATADATHFTVARGFSGTTAAAHAANATVRFPLVSAHVNGTRGAVLALEAKLGAGASDAVVDAHDGDVLTRQSDGTTAWAAPAGGGGSGTVESVDVSGGTTGLTTSGGPVTTSGTITFSGTLNIANGGTGATSASGARTNLGLGTAATKDVPASGNASSSEVVKGDDTRLSDSRAPTSHTHPESDITGLVSDLAGKQAADSDLTAVAGLSSTGLLARTGAGAVATRTVTAGSSKVTVTNGDGVSGNPTVDLGTVNFSDLTGAATNAQLPSTLSSKTLDNTNTANFKGTLFTLQDATDTSKQARFDMSNIATATTRTVNIPNANSTTVQSATCGSNQFASAVSAQGVVTCTTAPVVSVFGRTGSVVAATNDYTWAQVDKATSSLADITTRSAGDLSSGTLPAGRMPALTGDVTTSAGAVATTLANSGVSAGTYTKVTVDAKGRVTTGATAAFTDIGGVFVKLTRSASQSITNATRVAVQFDVETSDASNLHDNVTNNTRVTFASSKTCQGFASVQFDTSAAGSFRLIEVWLNGATTIGQMSPYPPFPAGVGVFAAVNFSYTFSASDYIEVKVYQDTGGSHNILQASPHNPNFSMICF